MGFCGVIDPKVSCQGWIPPEQFTLAVSVLPLVSVDWYVFQETPSGRELLLGRRNNRPAQGVWFTPGGRIRKNEPVPEALQRVATEELGLTPAVASTWLPRAALLGAFDHLYADSAFDPNVSTHYVNLVYALTLTEAEAATWVMPPVGAGHQHAAWRWQSVAKLATDASVHPNVLLAFSA